MLLVNVSISSLAISKMHGRRIEVFVPMQLFQGYSIISNLSPSLIFTASEQYFLCYPGRVTSFLDFPCFPSEIKLVEVYYKIVIRL